MDEQEKTESYRALYRVRPLIYHIGDIRLWMPIRQDGVVLWLVYIVVFFVFCYVFPILAWLLPFDRTVMMVIGPIAAAYYTVKLDPAGKTVPRYLHDIVQFLLRPKWIVSWKAIRQPGGRRKIHFAGYCRPYERISHGQGIETWKGASAWVVGTVKGLQRLWTPANVYIRWRGKTGRLFIRPLKRSSERSKILSDHLETSMRKTVSWRTSIPLQMDREERENLKEFWEVTRREEEP